MISRRALLAGAAALVSSKALPSVSIAEPAPWASLMKQTVSDDGGYLVPTEYQETIMRWLQSDVTWSVGFYPKEIPTVSFREHLESSTAAPPFVTIAEPAEPVLTRETLKRAMEKMIENDQKPRPRWPTPEELKGMARQPILSEAEMRAAELEDIVKQLDTSGSVAEFYHWWREAQYHTAMYGDGSGRPLGLFAGKTKQPKDFEGRRWDLIDKVTRLMLDT